MSYPQNKLKHILIILTVFCTLSAIGQQLPEISSNVTEQQTEKSHVINKFSKKYEEIFSYTVKSFWLDQQTYHIFGYNGKKWTLIKWTVKFDDNQQIIKERVKTKSFSSRKLSEILSFLETNKFWNLDQDSLNLSEKDNGDGSSTVWMVSDGSSDIFETYKNGSYRITSSYEANRFQELAPTKQRQIFIECRDKFWKMINKKSG